MNSRENFNPYVPHKSFETKSGFDLEQEKFLNKKLAEMKEDALLEEDFLEKPFTKEYIEECLLRVQKLEALFYNKLGGSRGWIPNALVWKTSQFDDYINGIDFIVETEDREFALATDVTFSNSKGLLEKLSKIKQNLRNNKLSSVTFYDSVKKNKLPLPHVIIAVEREKIIKALTLWADGDDTSLENHPLKAKTMLELEAQLESFALYAKAVGNREIASSYNDTLAQIQRLIVDYSDQIERYKHKIDEDTAYQTIISFCDNLKVEAQILEKNSRN